MKLNWNLLLFFVVADVVVVFLRGSQGFHFKVFECMKRI